MTPEQWAEIQDDDAFYSLDELEEGGTISELATQRRLLVAHVRELEERARTQHVMLVANDQRITALEAQRAETTKEVSRYQHACELGANRITALQAQLAQRDQTVQRLDESLKRIVDPIAHMRAQLKPGERLEGGVAFSLSEDPNYLKSIARAALKEHQS